jgi:hypothetical protein
MLGRAQNGETLTFTKIVVGSGTAGQPSDLWPLTALIAYVMDVTISSKRDFGNGTLLVEGNFRSDAAPHAFDLKEVGVMAHCGAEADRLYSVANVFLDVPVHIDPAAPIITAFKIKLIIDRIPSGDVVVQIGPSEAVTGENIGSDTVGPGFYKESIANLQRFKRAHAGVNMVITEDPSGDFITFATNALTVDVDLYVPLSYPSPPPGALLFPTIQAAHDFLLQYRIPADRLGKIHVAGGRYTAGTPIQFTHPDAARIQVLGQDVIAKTVSGTITRAGTLPQLDITVPVPSGTAGIQVNDVCYLYDAPSAQMEGCGVVNLVQANSVRIRMRIANVLPPASIAALPTTKLLIFPCQYTSTLSGAGIGVDAPSNGYVFTCPNGINLIKNFALRASTALVGGAVVIYGNGGLEGILAANFSLGIGIGGSGTTYLAPMIAANGCQVGIQVGPGAVASLLAPTQWARFSYNGCTVYGVWIVGGSYVNSGNGSATYACSNVTGIRSDVRGWLGLANTGAPQGGIVAGWNINGCVAGALGIILTSIDVESAVQANVTWDLVAATGAQISFVYNSQNTGRYSPALNVLGPSGGYIAIGAINPITGAPSGLSGGSREAGDEATASER